MADLFSMSSILPFFPKGDRVVSSLLAYFGVVVAFFQKLIDVSHDFLYLNIE
ncbi:MAG: hypothetical protein U9N55_06375 [candidate division Zixibacteria bacterium]|nr:hypothetical protein [candidate division Zixibacteria bacterium]